MPVILRFLLICAILAGCVYAGLWALATLYEPEQREITVTIPSSKLPR
ncbi:histidine kinase [Alsobacter soli]|uniref:Histidine kinase n=1 Tax=Alsobacter soli TaxID=2109933 RepID=A0A2T1HMS5_9HYPH|nr:histidine kinase [Alsobacter soli]PSC02946.1 histidine kinase [Alsobacter soli]